MNKKLISTLAIATMALTACGTNNSSATKEEKKESQIKVAMAYGAAHGEQSFFEAVVAIDASTNKIVGVAMDEYQYFNAADVTGVPNSDKKFGEGTAEGKVLGSKLVNNDYYSENMKKKANSTVAYKDNYEAIKNYVKGKTADELADKKVDDVSGATLEDTAGYLTIIANAAKEAAKTEEAYTVSNLDDVKVGQVDAAVHGEQSFGIVTAFTEGDTVVAAVIDELQYFNEGDVTAVPNSDKKFGEGAAEGKVLGSKLVNNDYYSENMKTKGKATQPYVQSIKAIEKYVAGKKVSELKDVKADAVSGSTLADTVNYVAGIVEATQSSK